MITYGRHNIDQSDIDSVIDVLKSDWLTCGSVIDTFERALAVEVKSKHAVACSNGTTALHLAMLVLEIGVGDTVLVPAITFLASANAARYVGADIVFVDIDPITGLMTPETLEAAILENQHKNLKVIVNVHLAGQCENLEAIYHIARTYNLRIIEDAAHAIGTVYKANDGRLHAIGANQFSDITTFSYHPVKTIAMGEGGVVTTNSDDIAEKLKCYRSHGMTRKQHQWEEKEDIGPWYYEMRDLGYNYRVSDINCALGFSQLKKLQYFKSQRANLVKTYDNAFESASCINPIRKLEYSDTAWHLYVVRINFQKIGITRAQLMEKLKEDGIGTQVHYIPLYRQPYYKKLYGSMMLSGAEEYYQECLSLPLYVGLQENDQRNVIQTLVNYVE